MQARQKILPIGRLVEIWLGSWNSVLCFLEGRFCLGRAL